MRALRGFPTKSSFTLQVYFVYYYTSYTTFKCGSANEKKKKD